MSLNLLILNKHGIWVSSDHRLTDLKTKQPIDDYQPKNLIAHCPDGPLLCTFAGLGSFYEPNLVPVSSWMSKYLNNKELTRAGIVELVRRRAEIDLGLILYREEIRHCFTFACFEYGQPVLIQLSNFEISARGVGPAELKFRRGQAIIPENAGVLTGFPIECVPFVRPFTAPYMIDPLPVITRKPRDPEDFMKLLAVVNRRTAKSLGDLGPISKHCTVSYMPPSMTPIKTDHYFLPVGMHGPLHPHFLRGIDLSPMQQHMNESFQKMRPIDDAGRAEILADLARKRLL